MSAADESKPGSVVALLRFTDKDSGMPEVERSEEVAVGVMVSESTPMTVSSVESSDELDVEEVDVEDVEDVADVVSGDEPRVVTAVDMAPGVKPDTTPGVESVTALGAEVIEVDRDRDRIGWLSTRQYPSL